MGNDFELDATVPEMEALSRPCCVFESLPVAAEVVGYDEDSACYKIKKLISKSKFDFPGNSPVLVICRR